MAPDPTQLIDRSRYPIDDLGDPRTVTLAGDCRAALDTTVAFGWEYHRATTLIASAQSRIRRTGGLDVDARAFLAEADAICSERGLRSWAEHIEVLRR